MTSEIKIEIKIAIKQTTSVDGWRSRAHEEDVECATSDMS